jgi:hypothetical protein
MSFVKDRETASEIIGTCLWDYFSPDAAKQRRKIHV